MVTEVVHRRWTGEGLVTNIEELFPHPQEIEDYFEKHKIDPHTAKCMWWTQSRLPELRKKALEDEIDKIFKGHCALTEFDKGTLFALIITPKHIFLSGRQSERIDRWFTELEFKYA